MKTHSFVLFAALAFTAASCSSPTDSGVGHRVRLTIAKSNYVTGETIHVDVTNVSDDPLTFPGGFCPTVLQEFRDVAWTSIPSGRFCAYFLQILGSHAHAPFEMTVPEGLQGHFRLLLPAPAPVDGQTEAPLTVEFSLNSNAF